MPRILSTRTALLKEQILDDRNNEDLAESITICFCGSIGTSREEKLANVEWRLSKNVSSWYPERWKSMRLNDLRDRDSRKWHGPQLGGVRPVIPHIHSRGTPPTGTWFGPQILMYDKDKNAVPDQIYQIPYTIRSSTGCSSAYDCAWLVQDTG